MQFNSDLVINKDAINPLELYYETLSGFVSDIFSDGVIDAIENNYSKLPKQVTIDQLTDMYTKSFSSTPVGKLEVAKIRATPINLSIFYISDDGDDFILDLDTSREDFTLNLY